MALQILPPGDELETHTVVDHREPARSECDAFPIHACDMIPGSRALHGASVTRGERIARIGQVPVTQSAKQIASIDDLLPLTLG